MNLAFWVAFILIAVAIVFFAYGTDKRSPKHVGIGGIILSLAVATMLLFGNTFL